MVHRLPYALDCLMMGVILSTAFSWAMIHHDIFGFATADMADVAKLWALFAVFLAPCAALTDWLFRDPPPADGPQ